MKPEEWDAALAEGERLRSEWERALDLSYTDRSDNHNLYPSPATIEREGALCAWREWQATNASRLLSAARREQRMREALAELVAARGMQQAHPGADISEFVWAAARAALAAEKGEQT